MAAISLYAPGQLSRSKWGEIHAFERNGFSSTIADPTAVDGLVEWDDFERYYASHLDPRTEVGRRYNANQAFFKPLVALAVQDNELIGVGCAARENVSGGGPPEGPHNTSAKAELIRLGKRLSVVKNHFWLRSVVVRSDQLRRGTGKQLEKTLLGEAIPFQPVDTYIWPEIIPFLQPVLESQGFEERGGQYKQISGEGSDPVWQVHMQARSARSVRRNL
jgi:hypothetical protein